MGTFTMSLSRPRPARALGSGWTRIGAGFALIIAAGTVLLMLPFAHEGGESTSFMDALFTAVSAVCVTGLVVVETQEHWSFFGEAVILVLLQVGGLGYMVGTSMVLWVLGRRLSVRDTHMLRLYYGAPTAGEAIAFALRVVKFALAFEAVGIAILWVAFVRADVSAAESAWWAVFHSLSAFNNAGFAITGADMVPYAADPLLLGTISILVIAGGIGAVPFFAVARRRSLRNLPLDANLIFITTIVLLVLGTGYIAIAEWSNPATLGAIAEGDRPMLAFFQATMPRTAGFSAIDTGALRDETKFLQVGLMFIGGAAGSTAGGIKVGAFSVLFVGMVATLRGRNEIVGFHRTIPPMVIRQALTLGLLMVAATFALTTVLLVAAGDEFRFIDVVFEAQSALSTVGLSGGITAEFNGFGKAALIAGMIIGRFGPLLLVLEMTRTRRRPPMRRPEDSIRLG